MSVTFDVFQFDISSLKAVVPMNVPFILVIWEVFQSDKLGAVESEEHPLKSDARLVVPVRSKGS
jgi:hypothetical protein